GAAARHAGGRAPRLPHRRVEVAGVARIEREIDGARILALEQHVLPAGAAVLRAEDAALAIRSPRVPERRDIGDVRIARMHAHASDVARVAQADVLPRAPAVGRSIDA